ncbi:35_t:CDS:2 [Gigaspora rosea]|nr:35_t:CDS:2 [Gigaspora rosea]
MSMENSNGIIALGNCYKGEIGVEKDNLYQNGDSFQILRITVSDFGAFVVGLMVSVFVIKVYGCLVAVVCGVCFSTCGVYLSLPGLWCLFFVAGAYDSVPQLSSSVSPFL